MQAPAVVLPRKDAEVSDRRTENPSEIYNANRQHTEIHANLSREENPCVKFNYPAKDSFYKRFLPGSHLANDTLRRASAPPFSHFLQAHHCLGGEGGDTYSCLTVGFISPTIFTKKKGRQQHALLCRQILSREAHHLNRSAFLS